MGDGVPSFRPLGPLTLFGLRVITIEGWNHTGRMFARGPGTAPPVHVGITVEGGEKEIEELLRSRGLRIVPYEGRPFLYITDHSFYLPKLVREFKGRKLASVICSL